MSSPSGHPPDSSTTAVQQLAISATVNARINYASWQNSVPLLKDLQLRNSGSEAVSSVVLQLHSEPAFLRPRQWVIDRIAPGSTLSLTDCRVELDAARLNGLNEAERSQLRFELRHQQQVLATHTCEVRVLARDEWGGAGFMP